MVALTRAANQKKSPSSRFHPPRADSDDVARRKRDNAARVASLADRRIFVDRAPPSGVAELEQAACEARSS